MTALPWIFYIVMILPSFGGPEKNVPVLGRFQLADQDSCNRFRNVVLKQIADNKLKFEPTECVVKPDVEANPR